MRYMEIDISRGLAVILMIIYHINFDIFFFSYNYIPFEFFAGIIGGMFIFISGISLYIAYCRGRRFVYFVKRFFRLLLIALMITIVTKIFLVEGTIIFGIIHFFAFSSLLIYPYLKARKEFSLVSAFLILFIYGMIRDKGSDEILLAPLGIYDGFTFDYYPIIPWFSLMLISRYLAEILYPNGIRRYKFELRNNVLKILSFMGKNSLKIYLIHQPLILLFLYLIGFRDFLWVIEI